MELPVYKLVIDEKDDSGVDYIALVDQPAILRNWRAFSDDSYNDYPKAASANAARALRLRDQYELDCGTQTGWARANQLADGENITEETIARMASFERHRGNSDGDPKEDCGALMWLAWGGDEGIEWAQRKLDQIRDKNQRKFRFNLDEDRQILSGFAMVADLPIYRADERGEYYVIFERDTIERIVHKYFSNSFHKNFNRMHSMNETLDNVVLFESMVIDSERGIKTPEGYEEAPDGSWFISVKVNDKEEWAKVKENFNGFSVEGFFDEVPFKVEDEAVLEEKVKQLTGQFKQLLDYYEKRAI